MTLSLRDQICTLCSVKNLLKAGMSGRQVKTCNVWSLLLTWPLPWYVFSNHFHHLASILVYRPSTSILLVVLVYSVHIIIGQIFSYSFSLSYSPNEIFCPFASWKWLPGVLWGVWLHGASRSLCVCQARRKPSLCCSRWDTAQKNKPKGEHFDLPLPSPRWPWLESLSGALQGWGWEWCEPHLASSAGVVGVTQLLQWPWPPQCMCFEWGLWWISSGLVMCPLSIEKQKLCPWGVV